MKNEQVNLRNKIIIFMWKNDDLYLAMNFLGFLVCFMIIGYRHIKAQKQGDSKLINVIYGKAGLLILRNMSDLIMNANDEEDLRKIIRNALSY